MREAPLIPEPNSLGYIITQVIDTGNGIDPKSLKNQFDCFNSQDQSAFDSAGFGLGLTTAKQLATALCGGI
jgi:K+-sensing histidine kinase KdpD